MRQSQKGYFKIFLIFTEVSFTSVKYMNLNYFTRFLMIYCFIFVITLEINIHLQIIFFHLYFF